MQFDMDNDNVEARPTGDPIISLGASQEPQAEEEPQSAALLAGLASDEAIANIQKYLFGGSHE